MKQLKKRLVGGHKKIFLYFISIILIFCNSLRASQILDFETELLINSLIDQIRETNNIKYEISYIILSNNDINAFVDENNLIYITSGLIENCYDYVALLSVLAHEIGHIDKKHIRQRKINNKRLKNFNSISNLSMIAGSLISKNDEFIKGLALSSATSSSLYITFSKDQEREADFYSLETLKKLELYSDSIIMLLDTIKNENLKKGLDKEKLKSSTHPYFDERIDIVNFLNEKRKNKLNLETDKSFQFIRAKFLGYKSNIQFIKALEDPYKSYAYAIKKAKEGDLSNSMKLINNLINLDNENYLLLETKADILFSYGYTNEAIEFYKKVLKKYPNNHYAKIRVFENIKLEQLNEFEVETIFHNNLSLLINFYNNKNILLKYYKIAKLKNDLEWMKFLEYLLYKEKDRNKIKENLNNFKDSENKDLLNLIEIIYNNL